MREVIETYKTKLRSKFLLATDKDIQYGMSWYWTAHRACQRQAALYGIPVEKFIAMVAVLSPQKRWEKNITDVISFLTHGSKARIFATKRQKLLCADILHNENNDLESLLGGLKVTSFYSNMLKPWKHDKVTIDRHAMRSIDFTKSLTKKQYGEIQVAHQEVALEKGVKPHELQAIIWSVIR